MSIVRTNMAITGMLFGSQRADNTRAESVEVSEGAAHTTEARHRLTPEGAAAGAVIAISGASQKSAAINDGWVRLLADTACSVEIGTDPTATLATSFRLAANVPEIIKIPEGYKVAVIGTAGNLYYSPLREYSEV